jgi:hypothetical protein
MWKMHKVSARDQGQEVVHPRDIDIDALALDFVTNLSLKEPV